MMVEKSLKLVVFAGFLGTAIGLAQVPEKHRGPSTEPQVVIQKDADEPLVIPAGIVGWIAVSAFGAILGLGGIVYKRVTDDVKELKENHIAMGLKIDRHYENIMDSIFSTRGK